ncbi:DUF406 family protein [Shewanella gelidii]|uniref:DUF406 family protein n=1 Tax=Shewanella gelidii TaxID=1642821 RepID=A0A917JUK4_9GAMM|nr:DUF406 family protein [Shewanella gelidii]MCL1097981.1 YfcZ/YiiS family protein [Shewanella gelidii]GGI85170.1 hypothetical protein GCM10009332_23130 [Shewanella gelidii]
MKSIRESQSPNVNDTCTDCGSFADIGAVIEENDTLLEVELFGETAEQKAEELVNLALKKFDGVTSSIEKLEDKILLKLDFGFSAEKMIFQMQNNL